MPAGEAMSETQQSLCSAEPSPPFPLADWNFPAIQVDYVCLSLLLHLPVRDPGEKLQGKYTPIHTL